MNYHQIKGIWYFGTNYTLNMKKKSTRPSSVCFVAVHVPTCIQNNDQYTFFSLQDLPQCKLNEVPFLLGTFQYAYWILSFDCPTGNIIVAFETFQGHLYKSSVRGEIYVLLIEF